MKRIDKTILEMYCILEPKNRKIIAVKYISGVARKEKRQFTQANTEMNN